MCREQVTSMFPREYKREKIKSPVALGAVKEASLSEFDLTANLFRGASPTAAAAAPYPSVTSEATLSAPMILTTGPALRHAWNIYRTCSLCLPRASMRWVSSRRLLVSSTCQRLARKLFREQFHMHRETDGQRHTAAPSSECRQSAAMPWALVGNSKPCDLDRFGAKYSPRPGRLRVTCVRHLATLDSSHSDLWSQKILES